MLNLLTVRTAAACTSRKVGPATSNTAARYCGAKSLRSLLSMLTKTKIAAVGSPVLVDMGRCRAIAWYARKMNDIASIRNIGGLSLELLLTRGDFASETKESV